MDSHFIFKRWFDWDPNVTRRNGKPAITGTKAAYVASEIPVVLIRDVDGLGPKGAIVHVKRGYARNFLVPNGDAVFGTLWENIDEFADPEVAKKQQVEEQTRSVQSFVPFDWLNSVKLEFLRETKPNSPELTDPISVYEFLEAMSSQEQVDLLPSQIEFPVGGIGAVGKFTVEATLNLTVGMYKYTIKLDVRDKVEVAAADRREAELKEAMKMKRPEFALGSSRLKPLEESNGDNEAGFDPDDIDGEDLPR